MHVHQDFPRATEFASTLALTLAIAAPVEQPASKVSLAPVVLVFCNVPRARRRAMDNAPTCNKMTKIVAFVGLFVPEEKPAQAVLVLVLRAKPIAAEPASTPATTYPTVDLVVTLAQVLRSVVAERVQRFVPLGRPTALAPAKTSRTTPAVVEHVVMSVALDNPVSMVNVWWFVAPVRPTALVNAAI